MKDRLGAGGARGGDGAGAGGAGEVGAGGVGERVIGYSVGARPIHAYTFGRGGETTLFIGSIHGSEPAGTPLLEKLIEYLSSNNAANTNGRIVIVPVANPDGLAAGERHNRRGIDLNRNFPAGNYVESQRHGDNALSEPESRALMTLIQRERPARIFSIHQPLTCVDWDGPGEALARRMASLCGLPARKLGSRPGSLGSWAGNGLGIPIITLELRGGDSSQTAEELWEKYGRSLLVAADH